MSAARHATWRVNALAGHSGNIGIATFTAFVSVPLPRRRCGVCGRFARTLIWTEAGKRLAWEHPDCARILGMSAVR